MVLYQKDLFSVAWLLKNSLSVVVSMFGKEFSPFIVKVVDDEEVFHFEPSVLSLDYFNYKAIIISSKNNYSFL